MFALMLMVCLGDIRVADGVKAIENCPPRVVMDLVYPSGQTRTLRCWYEGGDWWYFRTENLGDRVERGQPHYKRIVGEAAEATGAVRVRMPSWQTQGVIKDRIDQPRESVLRVEGGGASTIETVEQACPNTAGYAAAGLSLAVVGIVIGWAAVRVMQFLQSRGE